MFPVLEISPGAWPLLGLALFSILLYRHWRQRKLANAANPKRLPLPPGPKPLPIIGNVRDMPTSYDWLTYAKWAEKYGDIIHVKVFGNHIILLNSAEAVTDLFEKKSSIYSDRPRFPMLNELMGWTWAFTFMPYGSWWRRHRKVFHQYFHQAAAEAYQPGQTFESRKMLQRLSKTPEDFLHHVRHSSAATIMRVLYGIEVRESGDPYISVAEEAMGSLAAAGLPGAFLVDVLPFLKHVPAWVPGAGFQRKAQYWRKLAQEGFVEKPFNAVKTAMASGTALPSVAANLLHDMKHSVNKVEEEHIAQNVAAVAYAGGGDTTVSTIQLFFLAMLLHPEIQKKAQAELDAVVGRARLPDFSDRPVLPYIEAILKETLRWQPVAPLDLPHCAVADGEYKGYYIPKGATMMGNAWSILHDERMYPRPHEYRPERFLKDGQINLAICDPDIAVFGFGRRICPGKHMATNGGFIMIASVLAAFDIAPAPDSPTTVEMTSGLLSYPKPFKCSITPRTGDVAALIQQSLASGKLQR